MTQKEKDLAVLRWAGVLGHIYASVHTREDGRAVVTGEYNTLASAKRHSGKGSRLYKRINKGEWQRVAK